ncbi:MAG: NAD-dependent epimerase/dehydratase family protein [Coriobacteriia bacterium]|nr:NAD-dependent epimerase/dehydratase family protein [Coriobacteriia bacterium]
MGRLQLETYLADLDWCANLPLSWEKLRGTTVVVSGATGMIGATLVDVLMRKNAADGLNCRVVALGRNTAKACERLPYFDNPLFAFEQCDISAPGACPQQPADYVLHLASTTHPKAYATQPISTVQANVQGLFNLLDYAARAKRFLFASSVEVYGQNRGDVERFGEDYCGYLDCNTLRAGYPESKRVGEALCQAYAAERGLDVVIPRLARCFGPTLLPSDTKALSQFLHKGTAGEDIVLKSEGLQEYSYLHVIDAVAGLLFCLLEGASGEAYNVAHPSCDGQLKRLAGLVAAEAGTNVLFDLPNAVEAAGFSTATKALMDATKLQSLGWAPRYNLETGVRTTFAALRQLWAEA